MSSSEMSGSRSFISPRARGSRSRDTRSDERLQRIPPSTHSSHPRTLGPYYKRHEIPVRDNGYDTLCDSTNSYNVAVNGTGIGDSESNSVTHSLIEKIEEKVRKSVSQDLEVFNKTPLQSLDSSIKFFKTTVEKIFETFYTNLQDLEMYKKRFHSMIEKRAFSVKEMEDFIKDMLNDVVSSELSMTSCNQKADGYELKTRETNTTTTSISGELLENLHYVEESYKNENYMTDSTQDDTPKRHEAQREIFNVYLLNTTPNVHIRVNDRSVLSEIIIKDENNTAESKVASAENICKLKAKRIEMEKRETNVDYSSSDREIPVKTSSAKKNIHSSKECVSELISTPEKNENKSFMAKICDYLCKKLRKSSFL